MEPTNTIRKNKPQYDYRIDIIKGFCILGVICIHFGGSFIRQDLAWSSPFYVGLILNQFFSFAVPVFVYLAGWLLDLKYGNHAVDYFTFFKGRLLKIVFPYLVVTASWIVFFSDTHIITTTNIIPKVFYYGVEPTLYFVPLILQLYILYPLIRKIDKTLDCYFLSAKARRTARMGCLSLFFALHILIGSLSYRGIINYYDLCRPFSPFWLFYFYAGMHFREILGWMQSEKLINRLLVISAATLTSLFVFNILRLVDTNRVGHFFERNVLELAYCRPEILPYDIVSVFIVACLLLRGWSFHSRILELFGKSAYYIYIWHIMVLLVMAWQRPSVMATCTKYPEVMLIVIVTCGAFITAVDLLLDMNNIKFLGSQLATSFARFRAVFSSRTN